MAKGEKKGRSLALYETILKLKDLDECCRFFDDLCTPTELRSLEQRFDVAVYLQQGLVYLDILEKTGASSATISRVRRSMLDNGARRYYAGGYSAGNSSQQGKRRINIRKAGKKHETTDAG